MDRRPAPAIQPTRYICSSSPLLATSLLVILLLTTGACGKSPLEVTDVEPSATHLPPTERPTPAPTETQPPPELSTAPPNPTQHLTERAAKSPEDVAGQWAIPPNQSLNIGDDLLVLTFETDGTYHIDVTAGFEEGMVWELGTYSFDGDVLTLKSDWCTASAPALTCTGTFHATVSMSADGPQKLRLVVIEDAVGNWEPYFTGRTLEKPTEG